MDTLDQTPGGKPAQDGALSDVAEEILDEVDIEEYAKAGKPVPRARRYIFKVGKEPTVVNKVEMGDIVHGTPVVANGVMFIATKSKLYAIAAK